MSSDGGADGDPVEIRVLHVDDDRSFLDLSATFLERVDESFSVRCATSGRDALSALAEEPFDCVVSDYDMPGMDGIRLLEAVREADPDLPFILFTGRGSEEVASRAIAAGVSDYVQKQTAPAQFAVLAKRIRNHCEARWAERSLEEVRTRYRRMLQTSPAPVVLFDREGVIDHANPAAAEMLGVDGPELLVGRSVREFVHEESAELVEARLRTVLEERESVPPVQQHYVGAGGHEVRALIATAPVVYDGKEGGQAVLTDVTDLHETERELLAGRPFEEQVFDALPNVSYHLEMDGEVVRVTVRTDEVTDGGSSVGDDEGLPGISDALSADVAAEPTPLSDAIDEGTVTLRAELVAETGERVPLGLSDGRLVGPDGNPLAITLGSRSATDPEE